jgi:hypothetical protein
MKKKSPKLILEFETKFENNKKLKFKFYLFS